MTQCFSFQQPLVLLKVQRVTAGSIASGTGLEFNLTDIRSQSQIVAIISADSLLEIISSNRSDDANQSTDDLVFYATSLGERYSLNSSQNTAQVQFIFQRKIQIQIKLMNQLNLLQTYFHVTYALYQ